MQNWRLAAIAVGAKIMVAVRLLNCGEQFAEISFARECLPYVKFGMKFYGKRFVSLEVFCFA